MPLSWNEIKSRALSFSKKWKDESSEDAEAKSFWDDFFTVFGISRRRVATFEQQVSLIPNPSPHGEGRNKTGFIDLLWKGTILVEHKSKGKSLDKAYQQAKDYFPGLKDAELPRYILVSDFETFRLYDLDTAAQHDFTLSKFVEHVHLFSFIAGYQKRTYKEQDPVNIEAAELMGKLHDKLKSIGYEGHSLEVYLVRLVFLLFADDTNIFEKGIFFDYLDLKTSEDGSDLAAHLSQLFAVLNTPTEKRLRGMDESLEAFPYVNGKLFEEHLPFAAFDSGMRKTLMDCCGLDWGNISPAIFGSLFQSVMDEKARRNLGAHYTSEKNILKLIKPLFLDELWAEFEKIKSNTNALTALHNKIAGLRFLDPACGSGNFLIITYREIRQLELAIILQLQKLTLEIYGMEFLDISLFAKVNIDKYYGIEYEEFPAQIAQVAMWLIDHQMNLQFGVQTGKQLSRIPLVKSSTIVHGNALRIDWQSLLTKETTISIHADKANIILNEPEPVYKTVNVYAKEAQFLKAADLKPPANVWFDYIMGNPPFSGKSLQNAEQKEDMDKVFAGVNGAGVLDYVTAWYIKAAQYLKDTTHPFKKGIIESQASFTRCAFVSTNSITQGEQVGVLWNELFNKYHIKIFFAHRTFSWSNEAKGNAAVHVVIIGFANFDIHQKSIYEYEEIKGEPHEVKVKNINPYLIEGKDTFIPSRRSPICQVSEITYGSMANDGGHLLLSDHEKKHLVSIEPEAKKFIRPFLGSQEFINNIKRWCIWLKDVEFDQFSKLKNVKSRIEKVKEYRLKSTRPTTKRLAEFPMLFGEIRQPDSDYLLIPGVSSENRKYIPIGFLSKKVVASDLARTISNATPYMFGVMTSMMHMVWVKYTCGRLKSDFRYSNSLVYNNFPWPKSPTAKQTAAVEAGAQKVLDARAQFPNSSLADLYDPIVMPPLLVKAHQQLDKAVDACYRQQPFANETKRIEFLFELYDEYTAGLFVKEKKEKKSKKQ